MRPAANEYAPYYASYVSLVPEEDVMEAIDRQSSETQRLLAGLDEARAAFRYAEGKWSIKEVIGHLVDAERVFGYRAAAIARGDRQPLPGFDEVEYVRNARFDSWRIGDLAEAYAVSRRANVLMFRNLPEESWTREGTANANAVTVRALAAILVGHERHHLGVLRERYGLL
jgi:hypothetical protein